MCGIAGIAGYPALSPEARLDRVRRMGLWQFHRGPDGWGEWSGPVAALGHNRLAILDLEGGVQPMASADGAVRVVFNGEIYNFRELRRDLASRGHELRTDHSDTEAIVCGYQEWGTGVFERLEGMFALAIWDERERRLVLARDRAGIKPLYHAALPGGLLFASEPKAILATGAVEPRLREEALPDYFMFRAPVHPRTMLGRIDKLPPATWLEWTPEREMGEPVPFWSLAARARTPASPAEAEEAVLEALDAAVGSHLVADVPVGVFLSGGVDSSLIAALIARRTSLDAFTVGTESELDERAFARTVADHLGQRLHARLVTPADFLARFDAWAYHNDDPVADPSALALMVLAEHARESGMTVMLAGEGADELFGGYSSYQRYALHHALSRVPLSGLAGRLLSSRIGGKDGDYLRSLGDPRFLGSAHATTGPQLRALFAPELRDGLAAWEAAAFEPPFRDADPLREAMLADQAVRLPADVLPRTDRATMAASLEARVPFLDRRVVELANALPSRWSVRLLPPATKRLLKRLAARHVPREVVYRPKRGFNLPVDVWLRADFRDRVHSFLDARALPHIDYGFVRRLYDAEDAGGQRWAAVVWAWLILEEWHRSWIAAQAQPLRPMFLTNATAYERLRGQVRDQDASRNGFGSSGAAVEVR